MPDEYQPMSMEERRAVSDNLALAIKVYMSQMGYRQDASLGDWVLIGSNVFVVDEEVDCEYFAAMSGGSMLQHVVLGLLEKAPEVLHAPDSGGD